MRRRLRQGSKKETREKANAHEMNKVQEQKRKHEENFLDDDYSTNTKRINERKDYVYVKIRIRNKKDNEESE